MKTTTSLLLTGVIALGFTLSTASAADVTASPRFREVLNEQTAIAKTGISPNLVSGTYSGNTAKWALNVPGVPSSGSSTPNLVNANYAGAASKNPYQLPTGFEIAPLVEKGKAAQTCEMNCCAKK